MANKVDLNTRLTNWAGDAIRNVSRACPACGRDEEATDLTLRDTCLAALSANYPQEQELKANQKYQRMDLGMRIYKRESVIEFTPEEILLLKKLINWAYPNPLIVTQAHRLIDPSLNSG